MALRSSVCSVFGTLWLAGAWLASAALAQAPGVQPGQIERQFQAPPQPRSQAGSFQVPLPAQTPPPGSEGVTFRLRGLALEGMTVYGSESWSADYSRLLGRQVSLADIYAFANALTVRYRNDGYLLSQVIVPAQTVEDGYVRLQAVEGYVAEVRFEGTAAAANSLLQAYAGRIRAERPATAATLERFLLLMNDVPGTFARALLVPSATQQGASDLVVQVTEQRFAGGLSIDNRGGRALGPLRASVDLEQRGLIGWGDRTSVRFVGAEKGEMKFLSVSHDEAVGRDGTRGGVSWSRVRSRPDTGTSFIPLDLETESDSAALTLSHPLARSRSQNLSLRAALTGHDGETLLFGVRDTEDRIRALRLGLTFDLADSARGVNIVDVELAHGFEALGASRAGDAFLSRANGKPAFTKIGLYAARLQSLQSVAPGLALLAAVSGQVAFDDLLSPELYSFGGEQFGRGYDPSEIVGDHGAALKLELRYTLGSEGALAFGATVYGFYDAGVVRQRSPGGLDARQSATSAGLGVRFDAGRLLSGYLELAKPLTRVVAAEGNRDGRAYGGLSLRF
ncbi:MAG: ShlB/FhaC/HecB family hemolysin secretion/activation protein [Burkholderiales bacterium]|nr:ShlB/FhaC/HecB family hemolysin secretion/activation protein [Burkholderiales bacterium]